MWIYVKLFSKTDRKRKFFSVRNFANAVKMFNDYLQTKAVALKIDPIDLQKYQNKVYTISDMLLKFYEKI